MLTDEHAKKETDNLTDEHATERHANRLTDGHAITVDEHVSRQAC
jgi:hypothetical protein